MSGFKPQMLLPMAVMYAMNQVDKEDLDNIFYAEVFFAVGVVGQLLLWIFLYYRIQSKNDLRVIKVSQSDMQPSNPLADAFASENKEEEKHDMKTVNYDLSKAQEKIKQLCIQGAVITFIHVKWGHLLPLVLSAVTSLSSLPDDPIFQLYFLNKSEEKNPDLKRPFKKSSPWGDMKEQYKKAKEEADAAIAAEEKKEAKKMVKNSSKQDEEPKKTK
eukprot:CAMPEP_0184006968 /NCGR_PEP_ID=MMETSP0954-20121128/1032_1 /TAXON_ID=627963 /ORGANISM="Aplanochytrium sp, Strain PBS07" /LENGTH=215 /DNA_ID=CAMNT_0026285665 /DNA_START=200 /DNA_END=847 /DNA_ORIENTATION=-